jgi:hypothetical protein
MPHRWSRALANSPLCSIQVAEEKKKLTEAMQYRSMTRLFDAIQEILKTKRKKISSALACSISARLPKSL